MLSYVKTAGYTGHFVPGNVSIELPVGTVQYSTVQYSTVQYSTVQYRAVQYSTVRYGTAQYSTVQYGTVQYIYRTVQYSTVHYSGGEFGKEGRTLIGPWSPAKATPVTRTTLRTTGSVPADSRQ